MKTGNSLYEQYGRDTSADWRRMASARTPNTTTQRRYRWPQGTGCETVVKLLLATDSVDPDSKDNVGRTPLSWAAWSGHDVNVKAAARTSGVIPDSKDKHGRTPLLWVGDGGEAAVSRKRVLPEFSEREGVIAPMGHTEPLHAADRCTWNDWKQLSCLPTWGEEDIYICTFDLPCLFATLAEPVRTGEQQPKRGLLITRPSLRPAPVLTMIASPLRLPPSAQAPYIEDLIRTTRLAATRSSKRCVPYDACGEGP